MLGNIKGIKDIFPEKVIPAVLFEVLLIIVSARHNIRFCSEKVFIGVCQINNQDFKE